MSRWEATIARIRRIQLLERHGHRCCFCQVKLQGKPPHPEAATIEHKIPKGKGGTNARGNLSLSCNLCNNARGTFDFDFYMKMVADYGRRHAAELVSQLRSQMDKGRHINGIMPPENMVEPVLTPEQIEADRKTLEASIALLAKVPSKKLKLS